MSPGNVVQAKSENSTAVLGAATADQPALAAILMIGALLLLSLQDGFVKIASSETSLWQFQMLRSAVNLAVLSMISRWIWGKQWPRPKHWRVVALRSLTLVGAMVFYFAGMPFLSLAEIAAGLYVFPLFIAVLSALVLGEKVGPRRVIAILIGFGGTLLILKPGSESFRPVALLPIVAGFWYACTILITRRACREESPITLAFGVGTAFLVTGALGTLVFSTVSVGGWSDSWPYLLTGWRTISLQVLALVAICSLLNVAANIGLSKAYQSAESSWLAPFDYTYLVFAAIWGYVLWDTTPDRLTLIGMTLIAGAGSFVAWRERHSLTQPSPANFNRNLR